jgi:hypothetical protein
MSPTIHGLRRGLAALLLAASAACMAPTTQQASLTRSQLVAEQHRQEELAVQATIAQQQRLERVAWPILRTALPLCADRSTLRLGLNLATVHDFPKVLQGGARRLGFSDTLMVTGVVEGSPAHVAGIRAGDRLTNVGDRPIKPGRQAQLTFARQFHALVTPPKVRKGEPLPPLEPFGFGIRRGASPLASYEAMQREIAAAPGAGRDSVVVAPAPVITGSVLTRVRPDTVCAVQSVVVKDDMLNAWTDGKTLWVTTAMLRFVQNDDELAAVVAHEVAHAVERHIDAKKANATAGAFFGALLDIAAATQGVNTQGQFTKSMSEAAAMSFSQAFENEADYTGAYLLARIGRPVPAAAGLWRRMAQEAPGSIRFASSHPTTAERFVRIEQAAGEIEAKRVAGQDLLPNRKGGAGTR